MCHFVSFQTQRQPQNAPFWQKWSVWKDEERLAQQFKMRERFSVIVDDNKRRETCMSGAKEDVFWMELEAVGWVRTDGSSSETMWLSSNYDRDLPNTLKENFGHF